MIKKIAIVIFIVLIASLSIAGCTSSTPTTESASPVAQASNTATQAQNSDLSSYFSQTYFGSGGTTIIEKPFTKSVSYRGNDVYTGVVRRTDRPIGAGFTAVIELAKTKADAKKLFNSAVTKAQGEGYTYRPDWVAQLQNEEDATPANEMWCGSYGHYDKTVYYEYDSAANSWLVVTES
ncbi:MAG: hypothetical protein ACXV7G_09655 [Halobacteriota archaeon]